MVPAVAVARDCASRVCDSGGVSRGFGQAATERATKGKRTRKRKGLMQILKLPNRTMIRWARADMRHIMKLMIRDRSWLSAKEGFLAGLGMAKFFSKVPRMKQME